MAQTIKLKRSATSGATPTTSQLELGEVAINTYDGKMYIKKNVGGTESIVEITGGSGGSSTLGGLSDVTISSAAADQLLQYNGSEWVNVSIAEASAIMKEYQFTATSGQSTFSGSDDNSETLSYTAGAIQVFLNGIFLDSAVDYTATNGTSIVLAETVDANDYLQVVAFKKKIGDGSVSVDTFTGNGSTTAFTLSVDPGDENNTRVFVDGVYQSKSNYSVSGTTLTFSTAPPADTAVEVEIGNRVVTLDTLSDLDLPDNVQLRLGTGQDLKLYHTGSHGLITNSTGDIRYQSNTRHVFSDVGFNETHAIFNDNGAVQLYHDNSVKFATVSGGVSVTGQLNATTMHLPDGSTGLQLGASNDTKFFHDGSNSKITHSGSGGFYIGADTLGLQTGAHNENYLTAAANGAVSLYYDNSAKLATASGGITVTGETNTTTLASGNSTMTGLVQIGNSSGGTLVFKRASANYIFADQTGGYLAFGTNGRSTSLANSNFYLGTNQTVTFTSTIEVGGDISKSSGNLTLDVSGDIILDADGRDVYFADGGTNYFQVYNDVSNNVILNSVIQDKDIKFTGNDGGSTITALTLDMSNAGYATFNSTVKGTDGLFTTGLDVRMGTDKRIIFQGDIGEIGSVAGFQATNTAGSANTAFGIRATDIRFATGSSEKVRVAAAGHLQFNPINSFSGVNNSILASSNTYMYMMGGAAGLYLADNANLSNAIGIRNADYIDFTTGGTGEKMRLTSAGKLLLNATSSTPADKFYINGDAYATGGWRTGTASTFVGEMTNVSGKLAIQTAANRDIQLGDTANPDIVFIDTSTQKVGIGTTSPSALLEVSGSLKVTGTSTLGVVDASSFTDVITNTIYTASGSLDIDTVLTGRDVTFTQGSNNLMIVKGTGNVGIGTTSPSTVHGGKVLQVSSSTGADVVVHRDDAGAELHDYIGGFLFYNGDTSGSDPHYSGMIGKASDIYGSSNLEFYAGRGALEDHANAAPHMIITGDSGNNGNVGIGTASPNSLADLHVVDTSDARIWLDATTGNTLELYAGSGTSIFNRSNSFLAFGQDNVERMRINTGGNVGIGTTTPDSKLTVNVTSNSDGIELQSSETKIATLSRTAVNSQVVASLDGVASRPIHVGGIVNEDVILANAGGNVGIGETSPANILHVNKTFNGAVQIEVDNQSTGNASYAGLYLNGQGNNFFLKNWGDSVVGKSNTTEFLSTASGSNFVFSTASTERMRIDSSGNVGIGTTSPASFNQRVNTPHLVVGSGSNASGVTIYSGTSDQGSLNFADGTTTTQQYEGGLVYNHPNNYMSFHTNGGAERMRIRSDGGVGIGHTGYSSTLLSLHNGTGRSTLIYGYSGDANCDISLRDNSSNLNIIYGAVGNNHVFKKDATEHMRIDSSGNVGIGNNAPNSKLHIGTGTNTAVTVGSQATPAFQIGGTDNYRLGMYTDNETGYIENKNGDDGIAFRVKTAGEAMRVDGGTGNVGIGLTNPSAGLHVSKAADGGNATTQIVQSGATNAPTLKIQQTGNGGNPNVTQGLLIEIAGTNDGTSNLIRAIGKNSNLNSGNDIDAFVVKNGGKVGIGTASPTDLLTVTGTIAQYNSYNDAGKFLGNKLVTDSGSQSYTHPYLDMRRWTGSAANHYVASIELAPTNADAGSIVFYSDTKSTNTKATTERMRISSNGNIGIGTASPASALSGSNTNLTIEDADGADIKLKRTAGMDLSVGVTSSNTGYLWTSTSANILFGTAGTERMRLRSNGDWVVSNTVANVASAYNNQGGCGWVDSDLHFEAATTSNRSAAEFGRNNGNSGDVITIRQQGTSVGMIGTEGGDSLVIQSNGSTGTGIRFHPSRAAIEPVRAGVTIDDTISLGADTRRFKDLYLSGGVYVGGTASANKLHDYEEGTWNPTIVGNSGASGQSYNIQNGTYVKVGSFIHATFDVQLSTMGTLSGTYVVIGGLPFAGKSSNLGGTALITYVSGVTSAGLDFPISAYISGGNIYLMETGQAADYILVSENHITNSTRFIGSIFMQEA